MMTFNIRVSNLDIYCLAFICISMTILLTDGAKAKMPQNGGGPARNKVRGKPNGKGGNEKKSLTLSKAVRGCEYEGKLYSPRATFKPDACTKCRCPRRGGPVQCTVEDCGRETTHCIQFANDTDNCCPVCLQHGCRHSSGQLYKPGEVIRNEACVRCYCPLGGGNPICDVTTCPLSQCVDPVKMDGLCCPICPNGPNCQLGLLTLPIGQAVVIEGAMCTCETFVGWDGQKRTLAMCNKD